MTITLYKSPGERNRLSRPMTDGVTLSSAELTDVVNIETPELLIERNDTLIGYDYAYIPAFGRYYFLNDLQIVNGNQFKLFLESDPLMSFRSGILNSSCIAKRSTSNINPEIEDNQAAFKNIPKRIHFKMANGFTPSGSSSSWNYILTLGGK